MKRHDARPVGSLLEAASRGCGEIGKRVEEFLAAIEPAAHVEELVGFLPDVNFFAKDQQGLLNTNKSLADIAEESGFYDQSHMTALFTRLYGVSPRRYREARQLAVFS